MIASLVGLLAGGAVLLAVPLTPRPLRTVRQRRSIQNRRPPVAAWAGGVGILIFVGSGSMFTGGVVLVLVLASPHLSRSLRSEAERRRQRYAMPETLEVVAMAITAGMTIDRAIDFVVQCGPAPARPVFSNVARQLASGSSRRVALTSLADHMAGLYSPLVEVLLAAERDGAPVALVLDRLTNEATQAYRKAAEERARRTPVLLLAPLMVCSFPAVLVGSVVPFVVLTLGQTPF